jgi:hypothetical protein
MHGVHAIKQRNPFNPGETIQALGEENKIAFWSTSGRFFGKILSP